MLSDQLGEGEREDGEGEEGEGARRLRFLVRVIGMMLEVIRVKLVWMEWMDDPV